MTVVNALTVDVEDYFHIHAFSDVIRAEDWDSFESRVERNTYRILDLLDSVEVQGSGVRGQGSEEGNQKTEVRRQRTEDKINETKSDPDSASSILPPDPRSLTPGPCPSRATFFILGWIAERFPALIREIHTRGHEVACHGYGHQRIQTQTIKEFKEDVKGSKEILEDLTGTEVIGYRAPTYSISKDTIWALEILFQLGFRYDSSIFPIKHDFYGFPEAPRFPFYIDFTNRDILSQFQNPKYLHEMNNTTNTNDPEPCALSPAPKSFIEFPITTIRLFRHNLPCSGGGYFRLFPYWYTRWIINKIGNNGCNPAIFYIHPWELDPGVPRLNEASTLSKFRTYFNLEKTESRLKRLLQDFQFAPLSALLINETPMHSISQKPSLPLETTSQFAKPVIPDERRFVGRDPESSENSI